MSIILPKASLQGFPSSPASVSAYFQNTPQGPSLQVAMSVNDQALRAAIGASFDGLEQPFVEVEDRSGKTQRVFLQFQGTVDASGMRPTVDQYTAVLFGSFDPSAVIFRGVQFGMLTNVNEVELQAPGESWQVQ